MSNFHRSQSARIEDILPPTDNSAQCGAPHDVNSWAPSPSCLSQARGKGEYHVEVTKPLVPWSNGSAGPWTVNSAGTDAHKAAQLRAGGWVNPNELDIDLNDSARRQRRLRRSGGWSAPVELGLAGPEVFVEDKKDLRKARGQRLRALLDAMESNKNSNNGF